MSNCCMRRPAKFHVDSAVRFWAIANIREGGVKRPPPVKRGLTDGSDVCFQITENPLVFMKRQSLHVKDNAIYEQFTNQQVIWTHGYGATDRYVTRNEWAHYSRSDLYLLGCKNTIGLDP